MPVRKYTNHNMPQSGGTLGEMPQTKRFSNTQAEANGHVIRQVGGANVKAPVDANNDPANGQTRLF